MLTVTTSNREVQLAFISLKMIAKITPFIKVNKCFRLIKITANKDTRLTGPVEVVRGVLGGRVLLPCDVKPPSKNDASILILFYAENKKTPIYR